MDRWCIHGKQLGPWINLIDHSLEPPRGFWEPSKKVQVGGPIVEKNLGCFWGEFHPVGKLVDSQFPTPR